MKWLDLFSGVGMYALGLEQAGHEVIGFCEVDKFCQKILKKHWPTKPISSCIKSLNKALTESSEVFLAKTLVRPAKAKGFKGTPPVRPQQDRDSFGNLLKPIAWYDLNTGSWRTWQHCFLGEWEMFSGPWPSAGLMLNGIAWQRFSLASLMNGKGSTLWPTMQATDGPKHYVCSYSYAKKRQSDKRQLHWIHRAILLQGQEGKWTANPRFAEEMMGLPKDYTLLETETPLA